MISGHVETCGPIAYVWLPSMSEGSRGGCGREVRKESQRWRQRYGYSARCALEPQPVAKCLGRVAAPVRASPRYVRRYGRLSQQRSALESLMHATRPPGQCARVSCSSKAMFDRAYVVFCPERGRAFDMCRDVATPNLYAVAQQYCLQAPDTRTTVMGRRSGSSSSNDDVERAGFLALSPCLTKRPDTVGQPSNTAIGVLNM